MEGAILFRQNFAKVTTTQSTEFVAKSRKIILHPLLFSSDKHGTDVTTAGTRFTQKQNNGTAAVASHVELEVTMHSDLKLEIGERCLQLHYSSRRNVVVDV